MARKGKSPGPSGFAILVVDDQEETTISSKLLLEREGHRVVTALSGAEALKLFGEDNFDLVVVDYFMPQMNGEEVVRAIRRIDADVQIILQTGYSGEKPPREMMRLLDIQGYHDKAEGPDRLLLWVDVALKAARHIRAIHEGQAELLESRTQLRNLAARLLSAQEEERERISRELHDQLGQLLTAIGLNIDWVMTRSVEQHTSLKERLGEANELVRQAIAETRELCSTLRTEDLRGERLIEEIKTHAAEFTRRAGLLMHFSTDAGGLNLPEEYGRNIYRIAQEALSNVIRHSAASQVELDLSIRNGNFIVTIADNGIGFDLAHTNSNHSVGIVGMRERARLIGAELRIESERRTGTTICLTIPVPGQA